MAHCTALLHVEAGSHPTRSACLAVAFSAVVRALFSLRSGTTGKVCKPDAEFDQFWRVYAGKQMRPDHSSPSWSRRPLRGRQWPSPLALPDHLLLLAPLDVDLAARQLQLALQPRSLGLQR